MTRNGVHALRGDGQAADRHADSWEPALTG
jgi:hypothetical protein